MDILGKNDVKHIIKLLNDIIEDIGGAEGQDPIQLELSNLIGTLGQFLKTEQQHHTEVITLLQQILKALVGSNRKATIRFGGPDQGVNMPLTIPSNQTDKFYLTLQDSNGNFIPLDPGETVTVSGSDDATCTFPLDSVPVQDPDLGAPPTVASGTVMPASTPANPNVPVTVTATFNLTSGVQDAQITDTVTVSTVPGARKAGILFGTPTPLVSSPANKSKK